MDPMQWMPAVKRAKKLTVFMGNLDGQWATAAGEAFTEFNKLAKQYSFGMKLEKITEREQQANAADVDFRIASGAVEFEHDRTTYSGTFDGKVMHGLTLLAAREKLIEKARIHLPNQPMVNTPAGPRAVGPRVRLVIVLHEFLHTCGLTNSQHTSEGVFQPSPSVVAGDTASGDKVQRAPGSANIRFMPPYVISDSTKSIIADLWQ